MITGRWDKPSELSQSLSSSSYGLPASIAGRETTTTHLWGPRSTTTATAPPLDNFSGGYVNTHGADPSGSTPGAKIALDHDASALHLSESNTSHTSDSNSHSATDIILEDVDSDHSRPVCSILETAFNIFVPILVILVGGTAIWWTFWYLPEQRRIKREGKRRAKERTYRSGSGRRGWRMDASMIMSVDDAAAYNFGGDAELEKGMGSPEQYEGGEKETKYSHHPYSQRIGDRAGSLRSQDSASTLKDAYSAVPSLHYDYVDPYAHPIRTTSLKAYSMSPSAHYYELKDMDSASTTTVTPRTAGESVDGQWPASSSTAVGEAPWEEWSKK